MDAALVDNLLALICDNCHLKSFPKGLENCPDLQAVEINWYLFGVAPDNRTLLQQLFQVSSLTELSIHAFPVPNVPLQSKKLKRLEWTKGSIVQVPAWVFQQKELKVLRLGCNEIEEIGEKLGQLTALQSFSLGGGACGGNPLQRLPKSLAKLQQLESFDLSDGQLATFPNAFWQLPKLQNLHFHYAGIISIPDAVPKNTTLRSFHLFGGKEFLGFPSSFAQLSIKKIAVDIYQPTCGAINSQTVLESMQASTKAYEVSFRGNPFPDYMNDQHITNQIIGVWKAPKAFSLLKDKDLKGGQYFFLLGSQGYFSNTIEDMPKKGEYGIAVFEYEKKHAQYSFNELQYANNCVFGVLRKNMGHAAAQQKAGTFIHFSFEYDALQDILQLTLPTGEVVKLERVQ